MKIIISILFIPLIFCYGYALVNLISVIDFEADTQKLFWASFLLSTVLCFITIKADSYVAIFKHELTHNLMAILTFQRPEGFQVFRGEGGLFISSGRGNFLVTLAPYFLLTFSLLILPLFAIVDSTKLWILDIMLGILTGFHTSTVIKDFSINQPDIRQNGILFSIIIIVLGNIMNYAIIISFSQNGFQDFLEFLKDGIQYLIRWWQQIVH
jgi:hypothetical protein